MLSARLRGMSDRVMRPFAHGLARSGVTPNVVTLTGVVVQFGVAYYIVRGRLLAAGLVAIAAAILDNVDGAVARITARTTKFGALLDSTTDRLSDALFFAPLAWLYAFSSDPARRGQTWVAALAIAALVASFLVSYIKARAEGLGFECNVGLIERAERLMLMIVALVFDVVPVVLVVLTALSLFTCAQRLVHVRAQARSVV